MRREGDRGGRKAPEQSQVAKGTLGANHASRTPAVGCVAKTHRDAERCVIASSTHPTGLRHPARLDPSLELNQGDPPCSSPPWPRRAVCSDRFWLLELRVSRTFLDQLRPRFSGHGYPARRAARAADPDDSPRSCSMLVSRRRRGPAAKAERLPRGRHLPPETLLHEVL